MILDKKPSKEQNIDIALAIKKNKRIIAAVMIVGFLIFAYSHMKLNNEKEGFYGETKWGMTIEEVQAIEDIKLSDNDPNMFSIQKTNIENIKGADGTVSFYFVNGMLDEVMILIVAKDMTDVEYDKMYHKISGKLTNSFGKHTNELGSLVRYTEKSKITLKKIGKNLFVIRYKNMLTLN